MRGPAAIVLPALVALLGPSAAGAATRDVWVAAVPTTWNAVPNARDALHGVRFDPAATTFPTVVYRRFTRGWKGRCGSRTRRAPAPGASPAR